MRIALNISPLSTGHKFRGTGSYTRMLYENLPRYDKENTYVFFKDIGNLSEDIDIFHYPFFDPFSFSFPLKYLNKTLITIHDLTPLVFPEHFPSGLKGKIKWNLQKFLLKRIKGIITDSEASKRDILNLTRISEKRVHTVYLAAGEEYKRIKHDATGVKNLKVKYNLPEKFALYVGDITWNKNIPNLIKAVKMTNIPLVLAGKVWSADDYDKKNPWNKDRILTESLIQNDKQFIRLGFITNKDIINIYSAASVFVMPSFYEGFGLPVLEAMQCGCPVITTHGGSLKEVADDSAYIVSPDDIQAIGEAIEKVVNDKELQNELSEKGIKQAQKFSLGKTIKETIGVYKN